MDPSRSALAPLAVLLSFLVLVGGLLSLRPSEAKPADEPEKQTPREENPKLPLPDNDEPPLEAPLAPVATGLAQRTITLLAIKTIAFSPNGKLVAVGGGDGTVRVWEFDQQTLWNAVQVHAGWLFDMQFHPGGKSLATGGGDNTIKIWSFGTEWKARLLDGHTDDLHGVAFTPDGKQLVSGSDDTTVRVWDLESGRDTILGRHGKQVTDVAMHPEGNIAATSSRDGTIRLWNLETQQPAGVLKRHTADVLAIAFSPDGRQLASASYDKSVIVWDVASKQPVYTFEKHQDWAFCVAFSTDGTQLATGGGDKTLFVWNLENGELLQEIEHQADVSAVAYSPDGKHFVAGLINGYLQLYRAGEQLEHFGVIPPGTWVPITPGVLTDPLPVKEFLKLHADLLKPESETWDASVGKLTQTGDGFTLQLLEEIDPEELSPPRQEMWTRARETLRLRIQRESWQDRIQWLQSRLERAATADLQGHPLEHVLKEWTLQEIGSQMQISGIREELKRIRAVEARNATKLEYFHLHERVFQYIDQLLQKFPENPPTGKLQEADSVLLPAIEKNPPDRDTP